MNSNTQNQAVDVKLAFAVFITCILISFAQEGGKLLSDSLALIP